MMENEKIDIVGWKVGDFWYDIVKYLIKLLFVIIWELYFIFNQFVVFGESVKKCLYVVLYWLFFLVRRRGEVRYEIVKLQVEMEGNVFGKSL